MDRIYVVDDACPEDSGAKVEAGCRDPRVKVLRHAENQGVGGAVMTGYRQALADGADVIVKIDGDGQMAPALCRRFVAPILRGEADYTKGNRFYDLAKSHRMPTERIFGNAVLSLPDQALRRLLGRVRPHQRLHRHPCRRTAAAPARQGEPRYFFETDMLFRLNTVRAVVVDVPMDALYAGREEQPPDPAVLPEFLVKHARNFVKRSSTTTSCATSRSRRSSSWPARS